MKLEVFERATQSFVTAIDSEPRSFLNLTQLIPNIITMYLGIPIKIQNSDNPENEWVTLNSTGQIIAFANNDSVFSQSVRAIYLFQDSISELVPELSNSTQALTPSVFDHFIPQFFMYMMSLGATIKPFIGTKNFFTQAIQTSPLSALILGAVATIPATAFYQLSFHIVTKQYANALHNLCFPDHVHQNKMIIALRPFLTTNDQSTSLLPKHSSNAPNHYQSLQASINFISGIGFGIANLGMVWRTFPSMFDTPYLKTFLLTATMAVQSAIGIHKSDKMTSDFFTWLTQVKTSQNEYEQLKQNLLTHSLKTYGLLLQQYRSREEAHTCYSSHIHELSQKNDVTDMWITTRSAIYDLQTSYMPEQSVAGRPYQSHYTFEQEIHGLLKVLMTALSCATALAASSTNIWGVAVLMGFVIQNVLIQYSVACFASLSAIGLNKIDTDHWREVAVRHYLGYSLEINLNPKRQRYPQPHIALGYTLALLVGLSNVYFTLCAFGDLANDNTLLLPVTYFCALAVGILSTTTRGAPTGILLGRLYQSLFATQPAQNNHDASFVDFLDHEMNLLVRALGRMIEQKNAILSTTNDATCRQFGLEPASIAPFSRTLNAELSRPLDSSPLLDPELGTPLVNPSYTQREQCIHTLWEHIEELAPSYTTSFNIGLIQHSSLFAATTIAELTPPTASNDSETLNPIHRAYL